MKESIVGYFLVIGFVVTKTAINVSQHLQLLPESLLLGGTLEAGRKADFVSNTNEIKIQFITSYDKVETTINSIIAILEPAGAGIESQEWIQIKATRLTPDKKEE